MLYSKDYNLIENNINDYLNKLEAWMNVWRLALAPHKCSYTMFTRYKRETGKELNLYLYGEKIPKDQSPKFLGLRFDSYLNFKNQMAYINQRTNERINILKILSYKRQWKLNENTLLTIYKSLVRSVLDYSCFIFSSLNETFKKKLQSIQNNALRIIYKKTWEFDASILHDWAKIETIETRMCNLTETYVEKAFACNNPLITRAIDDYAVIRKATHINPQSAADETDLATIIDNNKYMDSQKLNPITPICSIESMRDTWTFAIEAETEE
jgi:hypothetical protein